jgi:hypothetical protein
MKKMENIYLIIIIVLVIALFGTIVLYLNKGKSESCNCSDSSSTITGSNTTTSTDESVTNIVCSKESTEDAYNVVEKYVMEVDSTGELKNYEYRYEYTFNNDDDYNAVKTLDSDDTSDFKIEYNDETKTVSNIYSSGTLKNSDGEDLHIWYKDYISNFESNGYKCS